MLSLRVMSLNLGGGVKNFSGEPDETTSKNEALLDLLYQLQPDVLCVQEIAQYIDAEGLHSIAWSGDHAKTKRPIGHKPGTVSRVRSLPVGYHARTWLV